MKRHNPCKNIHHKLQVLLKICIKRTILTALFVTVILVGFLCQIGQVAKNIATNKNVIEYKFEPNNTSCYKTPETVLRMADDSFKPSNKNIYFVETSCKGGLNSRQACSVETAARANQNRSVIVLVTGPLSEQFLKGSLFLKMVTELNIEFIRINVTDYSRGTPLEEMFKKEVFKTSKYPVVHTSDALRILTIYKYGGVYFDLDVIVVKSFDTLPANFIVFANNYIIAASNDLVGKNFTTTAVKNLAKDYRPKDWSYNGPKLMMRTLDKICDKGKQKNNETCHGFHVLDTSLFYAVPYQSWHRYMEDWSPSPSETQKLYTHHIWNAMGQNTHVPKNSFYVKLAKQYCPMVYEIYKEDFGA